MATRHRAEPLRRTLASLAKQAEQPAELIVVDASDDRETRALCAGPPAGLTARVDYRPAATRGAASQRNEGVARATQPLILFLDDDVLFEPDCLARMHRAMEWDARLGGVNAMITNQQYGPPGRASRLLYRLLHGRAETSYAGRVLGPGLNLLPEDRPELPETVPVEWLNTTCVLYRREALPAPPFPARFTGYSMMEDLTLSLRVAQGGWTLANARTARIFHDSQPGDHKNDPAALGCMELVNRHYVMTEVLGRRRAADYLRLATLELFGLLAAARLRPGALPTLLAGKLAGGRQIIRAARTPGPDPRP